MPGTVGPIGVTARGGPVQSMRDQWVDAQMSQPAVSANPLGAFLAVANPTSKGVDVTFRVVDATGASTLSLLRASVMDVAQAAVLQTWAASEATFTWSDTDSALQQTGQAFYWVRFAPKNVNGSPVTVGPQYILLNASLVAPLPATAISASHAAAQNGAVLLTCNVAGLPSGDSVRISVTGYQANPAPVNFAQASSAPLQFPLQATGETVTLTALVVSSGGVAATSGPTCTLTLNGTATAAAQIQNVQVVQISTGNQVQWPSCRESGVTQYQLYRGQRGGGYGAASLLATIAASSVGEVIYLDTAGLGGDYEYFVVAVCSTGNSPASTAANPQILFSSSNLPPNTTANQVSTGFIDSFDAGSNATIRIYGPGGPGTSWTKYFGYGTATRPAGSVTGLAYATNYYVLFQIQAQVYLASTTYTDTLPDGYEWVATLQTAPSAGGGGGTATASAQTWGTVGSPGGISSVYPVNKGYGYGSASVSISGGSGSGAAANAVCQYGQVVAYNITNPGSGYTSNPSVTVTKTSNYTGGGPPTGGVGAGGSRYVLTS